MVRDLTLSLVPSEPSSLRGWYEKQPTKVYTLTQNANKAHLRAIQVEGNYPGAGVDLTRALCQDDRQRVAMRGWSSVSTMATPSLTRISCTV